VAADRATGRGVELSVSHRVGKALTRLANDINLMLFRGFNFLSAIKSAAPFG
jgi:hypothetical protein